MDKVTTATKFAPYKEKLDLEKIWKLLNDYKDFSNSYIIIFLWFYEIKANNNYKLLD